ELGASFTEQEIVQELVSVFAHRGPVISDLDWPLNDELFYLRCCGPNASSLRRSAARNAAEWNLRLLWPFVNQEETEKIFDEQCNLPAEESSPDKVKLEALEVSAIAAVRYALRLSTQEACIDFDSLNVGKVLFDPQAEALLSKEEKLAKSAGLVIRDQI